ncbi:MAG: hypothetical protein ACR2KK_04660 [Acidimicrobiales bacterium]
MVSGRPVRPRLFADRLYDRVGPELKGVELAGSGYRWIRLRETPGC